MTGSQERMLGIPESSLLSEILRRKEELQGKGLEARIARALVKHCWLRGDSRYVDPEFLSKTPDEVLLEIRGLGKKSLKSLRDFLAKTAEEKDYRLVQGEVGGMIERGEPGARISMSLGIATNWLKISKESLQKIGERKQELSISVSGGTLTVRILARKADRREAY